jgi:hypothetical protein
VHKKLVLIKKIKIKRDCYFQNFLEIDVKNYVKENNKVEEKIK